MTDSAISTTKSSSSMGTIPLPSCSSPPYATINIKNHILVTLELEKPNFNRWEPFITSLRRKLALLPHVDG